MWLPSRNLESGRWNGVSHRNTLAPAEHHRYLQTIFRIEFPYPQEPSLRLRGEFAEDWFCLRTAAPYPASSTAFTMASLLALPTPIELVQQAHGYGLTGNPTLTAFSTVPDETWLAHINRYYIYPSNPALPYLFRKAFAWLWQAHRWSHHHSYICVTSPSMARH